MWVSFSFVVCYHVDKRRYEIIVCELLQLDHYRSEVVHERTDSHGRFISCDGYRCGGSGIKDPLMMLADSGVVDTV